MSQPRILIIEPDAILGKQYASHLINNGYSVTHCRTVKAAISHLDTKGADLVITELVLPMHNGLEFLYEFRSYSDWQHIPVIILTFVSYDRLKDALGYKSLNIEACLYKPQTSLDALTIHVENALSKATAKVV